MPEYGDRGFAFTKQKKRKVRRKTPVQRGVAEALGGVTGGTRKTTRRVARPKAPAPSTDAYTQLRKAGALDKRGRQKELVRQKPRKRSEQRRIVRTKRGRTTTVPRKDWRMYLAALDALEQTESVGRRLASVKAPDKGLVEDILEETPTAKALEAVKSVTRSADLDEAARFAATGRPKPDPKAKRRKGSIGAVVAGQAGPHTLAATFPVRGAVETGRAFKEDPAAVTKNTALGLKDMVVGIPAGVVKAVKDPKGAAEEYVEDVNRRYGPLMRGEGKKYRERIKKEGAAAEILEGSALVGGGGAVAGRITRAAGRTPKPRPRLRVSGRSKPQAVSPNLVTEAVQRAEDIARRKKTARRVKRAEKTGGRVGPLEEAAVRTGEVVPLRVKKRQRRMVAERKSRGVQAMKGEQAREVHAGARKALAKLSAPERKGFKYAMQLGIRDPKTAVKELSERRAAIVAAREAEGTVIPKALRKTNDELRAIDELIENADSVFTPRLAKVVEMERRRNIRLSTADPGLAPEQVFLRRYLPLAEHLKVKRRGLEELETAEAELADVSRRLMTPEGMEGKKGASTRIELLTARKAVVEAKQNIEPLGHFARRVQKEADRRGLARPAYFPSQKRPTVRFSDYALGGTKAVAEDKAWTGALFRTGREDVNPDAYVQAVARNVKRKHNWQTVADNFDTHSFDWGRNKTIGQILDELDRRNIDPSQVAFWNPRKYREVRKEDVSGEEPTGLGEEPVAGGLTKAVDDSTLGPGVPPASYKNTSGWSVVPREVYEEIHADTRPSGRTGRGWDVVKGKQSRLLLGTSPPWLMFQAASNTLLTALAKTGPIDAVKAQVWWRRLSPDERAAVEPYVGLGPAQVDVQQTKLGASANGRLVNAYRAFKQTPLATRASRFNPLDALFRADNAQNNFFRRSVIYSQLKRDAYDRMGRNVTAAQNLQNRLVGLFSLGPEKQIKGMVREMETLERHAQTVKDFLGDYVTYTAKERRILQRSVMFYGFLRFSVNFTFWTMPTKHPVMTALVGNLSRMQAQEVRELLGGNELPFAFGRIYFTKDGKLRQSDLSRMNPAANIITQAIGDPRPFGKLIAALPPVVQTALDIGYEKVAFKGKTIRVGGETGFSATGRESTAEGLGLEATGRFALSRLGKLTYPYRVWETMAYKGVPQGDTALPWSPHPTKYKEAEIVRGIRRQKKVFKEKGTTGVLLEEAFPFLPQESRDVELAKSIRERRAARHGKRKKKSSGSSLLPSGFSGGGSNLPPGFSGGGSGLPPGFGD